MGGKYASRQCHYLLGRVLVWAKEESMSLAEKCSCGFTRDHEKMT